MCPCAVSISKSQMKLKSYQSRTIFCYSEINGNKTKNYHFVQCKKPKYDGNDLCYKHLESLTKGKHIYQLPDIINKCTILNSCNTQVKSPKKILKAKSAPKAKKVDKAPKAK